MYLIYIATPLNGKAIQTTHEHKLVCSLYLTNKSCKLELNGDSIGLMINKRKPTKLKSEVLKAPDLAQMLGIDVKTVYRHAALGELPSIRIGRQWLFPKKAIFEWLKSGKKPTITKNFISQKSAELPLFKKA